MAVDRRCGDDPANRVRVVDEILTKGLARSKIEFFRQVPYLGPPEKPNRQDAPTLPLHTGQAPQP
jgi:hypothetical protein